MERQKILFESGNELAAYAAKQINYHVTVSYTHLWTCLCMPYG